MQIDGPNISPTCGKPCSSSLLATCDLPNINLNEPHALNPPNISSAVNTFDKNRRWSSDLIQSDTDTSIEMCVVSSQPNMLSILVTIRRSAILCLSIGMVQTSILLVERHVLSNCKLPPVYPISIDLPLQTYQIYLQHWIFLVNIGCLPDGHLS